MDNNINRDEIFVRKQNEENDSSENLKEMIRVVPSVFWLTLVAGVVIVISVIFWSFNSYIITTTSTTGLYHPGAVKEGEVLCFVPISTGKKIQEGMNAGVCLTGYDQQKYGYIKATVTYVDPYVTSVEEMKELLGDDSLVSVYSQSGPVMLIVCKLEEDASSENGYKWSNEKGSRIIMNDGSFATVILETGKIRPIQIMYSDFGN